MASPLLLSSSPGPNRRSHQGLFENRPDQANRGQVPDPVWLLCILPRFLQGVSKFYCCPSNL